MTTVALLLCVSTYSSIAGAHVAPAVDRNNRYINLTPMGDRIRVAYTIFWGHVPGAQIRQQLDRNRDRQLSEDETRQFTTRIAGSVARALRFEVDGTPQKLEWTGVHLGLNTPDASGGAFSVDLVGWLCLSEPRTRRQHELRFYDGFRLDRPGETELRVREMDGISVKQSTIGTMTGSLLHFRWQGGSTTLERDGYLLRIEVDPEKADIGVDDLCEKRSSNAAKNGGGKGPPGWLIVLVAVAMFSLGWVVQRRLQWRKRI